MSKSPKKPRARARTRARTCRGFSTAALSNRQRHVLAARIDSVCQQLGLADWVHKALHQGVLPELPLNVQTPAIAAQPGTAARVTAMAERQRIRLPLFLPGDAAAVERPAPKEWVLVVRLKAKDEDQAYGEAARILRMPRTKRYALGPRASVEAV